MVSSGMAKAGYVNVNLDDAWMSKTRNASGYLRGDPERFPHDMAWLGQKIHALGLSYGEKTARSLLSPETTTGHIVE